MSAKQKADVSIVADKIREKLEETPLSVLPPKLKKFVSDLSAQSAVEGYIIGKDYERKKQDAAVKELKEERWCIYTSHDREGCACLPGKHHYVIDERNIDEKFGSVGKE